MRLIVMNLVGSVTPKENPFNIFVESLFYYSSSSYDFLNYF